MSKSDKNFNLNRARLEAVKGVLKNIPNSIGLALLQRRVDDKKSLNLIAPDPSIPGLSQIFNLLEEQFNSVGFKTNKFFLNGLETNSQKFPRRNKISTTTIAVLNAGLIPLAALQFPRLFSPKTKRVGVWFWELENIPKFHLLARLFLDEIWVPSTFIKDSYFAAKIGLKIKVWPVPLPEINKLNKNKFREKFNFNSDDYIFGYVCDIGSSPERKNPEAAIKAYLEAFPTEKTGLKLALKITRGSNFPKVIENLENLALGRKDVHLITDYLDADIMESFYLDIDTYVSPHRSEGLGLTIYSAVSAGKNVIATGYSGNMDLMGASNFQVTDFELVKIGENPVYPADSFWAEPSISSMAEQMKESYENSAHWTKVGNAMQEKFAELYSMQRLQNWLLENLK